MCSSSTTLSSLRFPSNTHLLNTHKANLFTIATSSYPLLIRPKTPKIIIFASTSRQSSSSRVIQFSWDKNSVDNDDRYNGWATILEPSKVERQNKKKKKHKGVSTVLVIGIATSVAAFLGVTLYATYSRKGFGLSISRPFSGLHGTLPSSETVDEEAIAVIDTAGSSVLTSEESSEGLLRNADKMVATDASYSTSGEGQLGRIIIPFAVDSAQQEAVDLLKKLKIIDEDVKADELCTRREYARWLVRANSQLERSKRRKILSSIAFSAFAAFDDVDIHDPDFASVQSLAEAGIVRSKLSDENFASDTNNLESGMINFFPESFVSRQDIISWKSKLEYEVMPGLDEEISRKNIGFLDVREISSDAVIELYVDILANERSILRRVFGQGKRFQPNKPCTKAQVAMALISGRMEDLIHAELSRIQAEDSMRQLTTEEIRIELLKRGDIVRYWERKLEEERNHGLEIQRAYLAAVNDLEEEKIAQENATAEHLKQRAAVDCQKQLLSSLKEEVDEMLDRLAVERTKHLEEQHNLQELLLDYQVKHEGLLNAKSILEAELEALRILRSWIEDEARKSQGRAKVLEEVGQRWKWHKQS